MKNIKLGFQLFLKDIFLNDLNPLMPFMLKQFSYFSEILR